jgi:hypothetical protein
MQRQPQQYGPGWWGQPQQYQQPYYPSWQQPYYQQQQYQAPAYNQQSYQAPAWQQSTYNMPAYSPYRPQSQVPYANNPWYYPQGAGTAQTSYQALLDAYQRAMGGTQ